MIARVLASRLPWQYFSMTRLKTGRGADTGPKIVMDDWSFQLRVL
jgi:hypothetical protein